MSQAGTPAVTPQTFVAALSAAAVGSTTTNIIPTLLKDYGSDALGFIDQEAQDWDTLLTRVSERLQAGESFSSAWSEEWQTFAQTERTQLWQDWTNILSQTASVIDEWVKGFTGALNGIISAL